MNRSSIIWSHVVKPDNLLGQASKPSLVTVQPPVDTIGVFPAVGSQLTSSYLSPQCDARAAQAIHDYALSVAQRIDLTELPDEAPADFVAVVVINSCPDPHDLKPTAVAAPWDATVITMDRMRQYDVLLYTKGLQRFAGIYPGAIVGVRGVKLRHDPSTMRAAEAAVNRIVHATFPKPSAIPTNTTTGPRSARVHMVAGPYGYDMKRISTTLNKVIEVARLRNAQLCVICGPFLPVPDAGKAESILDAMPPVQDVVDLLGRLQQVTTRENPSMHVAFLPSVDDLTCIPIVPTTTPMLFPANMDPLTVHFECSNPTEFDVGGLRIGVCSYDALSLLAANQLDRGLPPETRIRQLCNAVVRSGLYVPNVNGHRAVDVTMLDRVHFGAAGGDAPHVVFYPNRVASTPIALNVGGDQGITVASCCNESELATETLAIMELFVADTHVAASQGRTADHGVTLCTIHLVPTE